MRYFNFYNQGYLLLMAWRLLGFGSIHMDTGLTALMLVTGNLWRDLSHCSNPKKRGSRARNMANGLWLFLLVLSSFKSLFHKCKAHAQSIACLFSWTMHPLSVGLFHVQKSRSEMKDYALCLSSSQGRKMSTLISMQFYGDNECLFADLDSMSPVIFISNFRYDL